MLYTKYIYIYTILKGKTMIDQWILRLPDIPIFEPEDLKGKVIFLEWGDYFSALDMSIVYPNSLTKLSRLTYWLYIP